MAGRAPKCLSSTLHQYHSRRRDLPPVPTRHAKKALDVCLQPPTPRLGSHLSAARKGASAPIRSAMASRRRRVTPSSGTLAPRRSCTPSSCCRDGSAKNYLRGSPSRPPAHRRARRPQRLMEGRCGGGVGRGALGLLSSCNSWVPCAHHRLCRRACTTTVACSWS